MLRTRDLFLFAVALVFLFVLISTVTVITWTLRGASPALLPALVTEELPPVSVVVDDETKNTNERMARIADLRQKIAKSGQLTMPASTEPAPSENLEEVGSTTAETDAVTTARTCAEPAPYTGVWVPSAIGFQESEGARVVYREQTTHATSSFATEVLLQLPTRSKPMGAPVCPPTDVIGVALDGSLMRMSEVALYSIFDAGSLLGYALDGFPVYGSAGAPSVDECGGAVVAGQYRYFLDSTRPTLITCFADTPISLP